MVNGIEANIKNENKAKELIRINNEPAKIKKPFKKLKNYQEMNHINRKTRMLQQIEKAL